MTANGRRINTGTRQSAKLSKQVCAAEPTCWLRLPGCSGRSTAVDHIIPVEQAPHLRFVRSNCKGACLHCNSARGATPISRLPELRARMMETNKPLTRARALRHIAAQRKPAPALSIFNPPKP